MREVKFKCWDKVIKVVREILSIDFKKQEVVCPPRGHEFSEWYNQHISFDEIELIQSTGLKDANDIEIYEGDILKIIPINLEHYPISLFFVRKIDSPWGTTYTWEPISGYECSTHIMDWDSENKKHLNVKVIGNIFKNKNLLEDKR